MQMPMFKTERFFQILLVIFLVSNLVCNGQSNVPAVSGGNGSPLKYKSDEKGNRVVDFSYAGYHAGVIVLPHYDASIYIPSQVDDATFIMQQAIDYLSSLPLNQQGHRGVIQLDPGIYRISGRLKIQASGIIIRGAGMNPGGTLLLVGGTDRETFFRVEGNSKRTREEAPADIKGFVPVNAMKLSISYSGGLSVGDTIVIKRPLNQKWIDALGMNDFGGETDYIGWKAGRDEIQWHRVITALEGNTITIDAPITTAIDPEFGGGTVAKISQPGRIKEIGIENLALESVYDKKNPKDENHCWNAISFEYADDSWVRQVSFTGFAGSAVAVYESSRKITIEDCLSLKPVSEIAAQRRHTFFASGEQVLFQRCYAEDGYHDFSTGNFTTGPIAFVQCESSLPHSFSGTIDRWASGILFDGVRVDGNALSLKNCESDGQGAGWTAANSMLWQCSASRIECYSPPTAKNYAYGTWGRFAGNGEWYEANSFISPRSLYYSQLADRIGSDVKERVRFVPGDLGSTSSPSVELAQELAAQSHQALITLEDWVRKSAEFNPLPTQHDKAKTFLKQQEINTGSTPEKNVNLVNGVLVINNKILTGGTMPIQWWRGSTRPWAVENSSPHITRFVPGRNGTGLTDRLDEVAGFMIENNQAAINHHYGLWYDRRRDDHERTRRMDPETWPPFYEQPFSRSGQGTAWDGLSKYDLTQPNPWYWNRLKQFADLADMNGLMLIHQDYFQHNILEAGAHWADFPWRSANNINNTGFPEPPPYAGDKRIFMAEQFYDTSDPVRNELHRMYIRQCLDNFRDNTNVIQHISEEFTGPVSFVEYWLTIINEWQNETGLDPFIGLSATKDVQDEILENYQLADLVDVIDIKYWQYREDSSLYAPGGGLNLAPRQHDRVERQGNASFASIYRAVSEYRNRYPDKAVTYSWPIRPGYQWAVFMAGGSLAAIPGIQAEGFLESAAGMKPAPDKSPGSYTLKNEAGEAIIYSTGGEIIPDLQATGVTLRVTWIRPIDGTVIKADVKYRPEKLTKLKPPEKGEIIAWIRKTN